MMRQLSPDRYYDEPYGAGLHVVLLCRPDELQRAAAGPYERVSNMMPTTAFWAVTIATEADAESVQAIRFPQYRFLRDGSELSVHIGLMDDDQLVDCFDHLEG